MIPTQTIQELNAGITNGLKLALYDNTYTPDVDTDYAISGITGEVTGTNYTSGGQDMQNVTLEQDTANDRMVLKADNVAFNGLTLGSVPVYAVLHDGTNIRAVYTLNYTPAQGDITNEDIIIQQTNREWLYIS